MRHFVVATLKKCPGIEQLVEAYEKTQEEVEKAHKELNDRYKDEFIRQIAERHKKLKTLPVLDESKEFVLPDARVNLMKKLESHHQLSSKSCAASGMEAVLKLHGLIASDDFPFQNEFGDDPVGFAKLDRLKEFGQIDDANADWFSLDEALERIDSETQQGRFPLISLYSKMTGTSIDWHIYVAARDGTELVLVDPAEAGGKICARSTSEVRAKFQETLDAAEGRPRIEIATYSTRE